MKTDITIAIITKNRPKELRRCLDSLLRQSQKPQEVLIIDNDQNKTAKAIAVDKKYQQLSIAYQCISGSVPKCRNFATQKCKSKFLGFADDDCILDKNWVEQGIYKIRQDSCDFIVGQTLLFNPKNIFALAQHARDEYWKRQNSPMFDTKNVILKLQTIKKYELKFDELCQKESYDSADFDFDFLVKKYSLKGYFCKKMIAHHQETSQFKRFSKRAYYRGFLAKYLDKKWQLNDQLIDLSTSNFIIWLLKLIKNFSLDYQRYSKQMNVSGVFNKVLGVLAIKIFEFYYVLGYVANKKNL